MAASTRWSGEHVTLVVMLDAGRHRPVSRVMLQVERSGGDRWCYSFTEMDKKDSTYLDFGYGLILKETSHII